MTDSAALSFEKDIRPMFTDLDIDHMKAAGIDLSDARSVAAYSEAIYATVSDGSMPPPSSGEPSWTAEMCERFNEWRNGGCLP